MWSRIPIVRLIIPYILGILLSEACEVNAAMPYYVLGIWGGILILGAYFYGLLFSHQKRWVYGALIISFMGSAGFFEAQKKEIDEHDQLADISSDTCLYIGMIEEAFELRERSCRALISLVAVSDSLEVRNLNTRVMVYTEPDSLLPSLEAGSMLLLLTSFRPLRPPSNPAEFDYKKYLSRRGIYHSAFLKAGQWSVCKNKREVSLLHYAAGIRNKLLVKLKENGVTGRHFSVSAALLLGDDSYLGDDIREIYARAGAMHILCVSGLHVGVIFLVLTSLLGFLKRIRFGKVLFPLLLIFSIWSYALITGVAAPVIRASCMISFIIIGNALSRQKNVYNTLAASGFLMLLLDPYALFSAGFQLSYSAVLGIVFIQRPLYNIFYMKHVIPDRIWAITSVSVAAQMGTLPIVLYYFHQFPVYSLLTNLIVIPLSSLIIYSGLLLFVVPSLSYAADGAAWMLNMMIGIMDKGVSFVEEMPHAAVTDINIDLPLTLLIFLLTISTSLFFMKKAKAYLLISLMIVLLFSSYRLYLNYRHEKQYEFVVYSVNGHSAYDVIVGRQHIFMADSVLLSDNAKINYSIKPNWLDMGLDKPDVEVLPVLRGATKKQGAGKLMYVTSKIVVWQGRLPSCYTPAEKLKPEYLILRGDCPFELTDILQCFDPSLIILDTSVPWWKTEKLKSSECEVSVWDTREKGAFRSNGL